MIIINLGQNDACGNEPEPVFVASYISFLTNIRAKFPKATILAMRPFSNNYGPSVSKAVDTVNQRGDGAVHYVDTTGWLDYLGDFVDGVHPNVVGNQKVAKHLVPLIVGFAKTPATSTATLPPPTTIGEPDNPGALNGELQDA